MLARKFQSVGKFLVLSLVISIGFSLLAAFAAQKIYQTIVTERIDKVRNLSEASLLMVKTAYARYQRGELTEEAAKKLVKDELRAIKFDNNDYYFIIDYDGVQVMHGVRPEREGINFYTALDPKGNQVFKAVIDHARDGTGISRFMFPRAGSDQPVPKLAYTLAFDPWRWTVGTGVYVDDIDVRFNEVARQFFSLVAIIGLLMAGCAYLLSRRITIATDTATIANMVDQTQQAPQKAEMRADYIKTFTIRTDNRLIFIECADIEWIGVGGDYAVLHVGTKKHLIREPLNRLEQQLDPAHFIRIHRSTIVRIDQIVEMQMLGSQDALLQLCDGMHLRVSRTYIDRLVAALQQFRGYVIPRQSGGPRYVQGHRSNIS